ncbi:MAG: helix-turn-helix domain-containing protein [Cyclobacteriaceae bacterium]|nr:helix-turn-helix domain-containing protein [Cyclobacteriaceae bacterium]
MSVQIITKDDLENFKQELLSHMQDLLKTDSSMQKKWLKSHEVRKLLKISPGTLQNLRVNGHLPYTKIGGTMFYAYEDILAMLEENKRG